MIIDERQTLLSADISKTETRAALMQVMGRVVREFGFEYASILTAPGPNDILLSPLVHESTIPGAFVREFDRNHFLRSCPLLPRMSNSILPQGWRIGSRDPALSYDCPPEMADLWRRFGIEMGMVFPLNSIDSTRFLVRYDGNRCDLCQQEINELSMITIHAFDMFDRMRRSEIAIPVALSARELEVVRWTAQGKTSVEIGQILSLSDHTVNAYMTNAIRKLDCVNRTQLVAKAIRLKLIN
ncbi:autoinducer binding domain-containing protein [Ciceribacter sp. L1K23]|uniref:helix-turn-helix transcriptional regulator n=1 Tax=unclassified Ciceribacter TaxID=2628820 RepID=UPI001ABE4CAD|nr:MULTISPECIES: LuxR family transcriptional regulator [unclassified Ciceribacter]MBO3761125.1 autoinducer binding domain-containing protein [Ciceribacter sp. L1K22]MBR0554638.1 autoinducer binding domain-containing protein [Ciceribacter sp. L1K23]